MNVSPYLFFDGRCEEAVDYYKVALGADVAMMMRFGDAPDCGQPAISPEMKSKIMHVALKVGETSIMASDGMCQGGGKTRFDGFSLSITLSDAARAQTIFDALAAEGQVRQPLTQTFFAPKFGVVSDKFGLSWMIVVEAQPQ